MKKKKKNEDIIEEENVDLYNRPVVENEDGSYSTVRSMSFQDEDGSEVLIPTVSQDGKILSEDEAIKNYYETGEHLGKFKTAEAANKYAEELHNEQEKMYKDQHRANILYKNKE